MLQENVNTYKQRRSWRVR